MRGNDKQQAYMFSYLSPEERVPQDHPLRLIKTMVNEILRQMSPEFQRMYAGEGRPSIAPEKLLRALLLQALFSVRSERRLMEELEYNLLFRWFVGLNMDDPVWVPTTFSKNRERLLQGAAVEKLFARVAEYAQALDLASDEHFTVDGTLIEAWASQKSFKPKSENLNPRDGDNQDGGRNQEVDFKGEQRCNETHASVTDPQARLCRKGPGKEARLCYQGHVLMENRNGLVMNGRITQATGTAERDAALSMVAEQPGAHRITVAGDKGYDTRQFVQKLRENRATPHVARKVQHSAIDSRTTRHPGYQISQRIRKRVEEIFGWIKTVAMLRKTRHRGVDRVNSCFMLALAGYNLVRMRNIAISRSFRG